MYTGTAGLPTATERSPGDISALGAGNWPSPLWGGFQGTQNPCDLKVIHNPIMVLLSSRPTGPSLASSWAMESLFSTTSLFKERAYLSAPSVFLKQEWQVIRAGVASGYPSAASVPTVQLIAFSSVCH